MRPVGWYCRYGPGTQTRRQLAEEGGFIYDSDAYNDDLPFYVSVNSQPWMVVPYAADTNDAGYMNQLGFGTPDRFYEYLFASFDQLWEEGERTPKLLSIGLHCCISGRPGRAKAIARFITYAQQRALVWFARRDQIARFWLEHVPPTVRHWLKAE